MISVCCPKCKRIEHVEDEHAGLLMICPGCRSAFPVVPMEGPSARPTAWAEAQHRRPEQEVANPRASDAYRLGRLVGRRLKLRISKPAWALLVFAVAMTLLVLLEIRSSDQKLEHDKQVQDQIAAQSGAKPTVTPEPQTISQDSGAETITPDQYQEALEQFSRGCDAGDAKFCGNLGYMYEHGDGVEIDYPRAISLYSKACDSGLAIPCRRLGFMYMFGRSVAPDVSIEMPLFSKACDLGDEDACTAQKSLSEIEGSPSSAQRSEPNASPVAPSGVAETNAEGSLNPRAVRPRPHRDIGVDLALPVYSRFPLMDQPDSNGTVIREIRASDVLVLLDRNPSDGWYNVIDIRSGKEGWVNQDRIQISLTQHPERAEQFAEQYVGSNDPPEVSVKNSTSGTLSLKIGEKHYTLQPGSTLEVSLPSGTYSYYATEAGLIPALGQDEWKVGYKYTWEFYVKNVHLP